MTAIIIPPTNPRFETPTALRARIATRLHIAEQDRLYGDTWAYQRNMAAVADMERALHEKQPETLAAAPRRQVAATT